MPTCHVSQFSTPGLYLKSMKPSWTSRILLWIWNHILSVFLCLCKWLYRTNLYKQMIPDGLLKLIRDDNPLVVWRYHSVFSMCLRGDMACKAPLLYSNFILFDPIALRKKIVIKYQSIGINGNVIVHNCGKGTWKDNHKWAHTNACQKSTCTFDSGDLKMYMYSEMDKSNFYCPVGEMLKENCENRLDML